MFARIADAPCQYRLPFAVVNFEIDMARDLGVKVIYRPISIPSWGEHTHTHTHTLSLCVSVSLRLSPSLSVSVCLSVSLYVSLSHSRRRKRTLGTHASLSFLCQIVTGKELGRDFTLESLRADGNEAIFVGIGEKRTFSIKHLRAHPDSEMHHRTVAHTRTQTHTNTHTHTHTHTH
jgi:hypothetical protein